MWSLVPPPPQLHRLPLSPPPPSPSPRFSFPRPRPTFLPLAASSSASHNHQNPKPLVSLLKPLASTLALSAAILALSYRPPRALAVSPPPPPPSVSSPAEDPDTLRSLLEQALLDKKIPEALSFVDRLMALEPNSVDLLFAKGRLFALSGDFVAATRIYEEILERNPVAVEAYHGLLMLAMKPGSGKAAADAVMQRVKTTAEFCRSHGKTKELRSLTLLVAHVSVMDGEFQKALGIYEEMAREDPEDFRPYLCRGILHTLMRKEDDAKRDFEEYRKLLPKEHPFTEHIEKSMSVMRAMMLKWEAEEEAGSRSRIA